MINDAASASRPEREEFPSVLDGWKAIANYLRRTVRTVQRWERLESLPVRRHGHHTLATVYAYPFELDQWLAKRQPDTVEGAYGRSIVPSPLDSDAAHTLCAMSLEQWAQRSKESFQKSIELARTAIRRAPDYAPAHAALALAYATRPTYGHSEPMRDVVEARIAASAALQLDPSLAMPYQALALVSLYFEWNWKDARRHFEEALRLNADDATTHQWLGVLHLSQNLDAKAYETSLRAEALDASSLLIACHVAWIAHFLGRYDEAVQRARAITRKHPNFWRGYFQLAVSLAASGDPVEAVHMSEIAAALNDTIITRAVHLHALALAGHVAAARSGIRDVLASADDVSPYWIAFAAAPADCPEHVFARLKQAVQRHDWMLLFIRHDLAFTAFRSLREFTTIVKRVGLP